MKEIYHIHHIVPKYMGGTDEPNNLVKLPLWAHAEVHKRLFEVYGNILLLVCFLVKLKEWKS
jgi:hypothetical protein